MLKSTCITVISSIFGIMMLDFYVFNQIFIRKEIYQQNLVPTKFTIKDSINFIDDDISYLVSYMVDNQTRTRTLSTSEYYDIYQEVDGFYHRKYPYFVAITQDITNVEPPIYNLMYSLISMGLVLCLISNHDLINH